MTKREFAVSVIKQRILEGTYRPGEELTQARLVEELGTGTTPIREAVLDLMARGFLEHKSHQSVRVAQLSVARVKQIYEVRKLLEGTATELAVPRLDRDALVALKKYLKDMQAAKLKGDISAMRDADTAFHDTLYSKCGNEILLEQIRGLWDSFPRYLLWKDPARLAQSIKEHMAIQHAIESGKAKDARSQIEQHLQHGYEAFERAADSQKHA
jgi:DNA-binding GntR family transcriptional regulator